MNMSWNYSSYSTELAKAIQYANSKGVISVASAGNDGQRTVVYPGALPGVIDVASTSHNDIAVQLHQLRCAAGLDGCSRRRHCHDLSVGHLCCGLGHIVQHAACRRHRRPHDGQEQQLPELERSGVAWQMPTPSETSTWASGASIPIRPCKPATCFTSKD